LSEGLFLVPRQHCVHAEDETRVALKPSRKSVLAPCLESCETTSLLVDALWMSVLPDSQGPGLD
jgi:hypothetical protein